MKGRNPFQLDARRGEREDQQMVGGYLPAYLADYLRLASLNRRNTVQQTLRAIISEWIFRYGKTEEQIAEELAQRAAAEWKRRTKSRKGTKKEMDKYTLEICGALKRRKIADHHIQLIIDRLKAVLNA